MPCSSASLLVALSIALSPALHAAGTPDAAPPVESAPVQPLGLETLPQSPEKPESKPGDEEIDPWVGRFLKYMVTDPDACSAMQLKVVRALTADGDLPMAREVCASMQDFRKPMAMAVIAAAMVARGEHDEAIKVISEAEESSKIFQDWRRRLIENELFYARNALNFSEDAKNTQVVGSTSPDIEGWESQARLFGVSNAAYIHANLDAFVERKAIPHVCRALACIQSAKLLQKEGKKAGAVKVLESGALVISEKIEVPGTVALLDIVEALVAAGDPDKAVRWLTVAEEVSNRLAPQPGWASQNLARCAGIYHKLGNEEKSKALFAKAESLLPKVEAMFLAETMIAVARARGVTDASLAEQKVTDMLAAAHIHPHHRIRAAGALEALLYMREKGDKLSPLRIQQFSLLSRNIEKDPYYQKAVAREGTAEWAGSPTPPREFGNQSKR